MRYVAILSSVVLLACGGSVESARAGSTDSGATFDAPNAVDSGIHSPVAEGGKDAPPGVAEVELGAPLFSAIDYETGAAIAGASYDAPTETIRLPADALGVMSFAAEFKAPGVYDITLEAGVGVTGWTLTRTPTQHFETQSHASETLRFTLQPSAGATSPIDVAYTIQRQGSSGFTQHYTAVVVP